MPAITLGGSLSLTPGPLFAVLLCFAAYLWLSKTVWGFEARCVGANPEAALNAGIAASKWQARMFMLSGALAGLAGAIEVVAVHHRFYRSFSPGYGFDGLTAAFLTNCSPEWLWLSVLFIASLRSADKYLQIGLNVSPNFIWWSSRPSALRCLQGPRGGRGGVAPGSFSNGKNLNADSLRPHLPDSRQNVSTAPRGLWRIAVRAERADQFRARRDDAFWGFCGGARRLDHRIALGGARVRNGRGNARGMLHATQASSSGQTRS